MLILSGGGHSVPALAQPTAIEPPIKPIGQIQVMSDLEALQPLEKLEPILPSSFPVAPIGTYSNDYEWGNCTEYVASRKLVPNSMGDANQWSYALESIGYTVSSTPIIGSIAQSTGGVYGHVAIVTAIDGDRVKVSEANVVGLGIVSEDWYDISHFNNYIYL